MKTYDTLSKRIVKILNLLHTQGYADIEELCAEFGVSKKTLQRDRMRLNDPNIYIKNGKILLQRERQERGDPQAQIALNVLKNIAHSLKGEIGHKALSLLEKLDSKTQDTAMRESKGVDSVGVDSTLRDSKAKARRASHTIPNTQAHKSVFFTKTYFSDILLSIESLKLLQECIQTQTLIYFEYSHKVRVCLPLQIMAFEGEWYLFAQEYSDEGYAVLAMEKNEQSKGDKKPKQGESKRDIAQCSEWVTKHCKEYIAKKFYLNDIDNLHALPYTLTPDTQVLEHLDRAINAWYNPYGEKIAVYLWVDKAVAKYFKRKKLSPTQILYPQKDGSLEMSLLITDYREISGEILRWIPYMVVLEPSGLREHIKECVRAYMEVLGRF